MTKEKNEWEIERERLAKEREIGMKSMTTDQIKAVKRAHTTLVNVLRNIKEMDDMYLSDMRDMDEAMWKLEHQLNLHKEEYN